MKFDPVMYDLGQLIGVLAIVIVLGGMLLLYGFFTAVWVLALIRWGLMAAWERFKAWRMHRRALHYFHQQRRRAP